MRYLIGTRHISLWQNFQVAPVYIYYDRNNVLKRHMAGFKAISYCLAHLKEVRDQPCFPNLEMSTAGLSICLSPKALLAHGTRGARGCSTHGEPGCPPLLLFSKYSSCGFLPLPAGKDLSQKCCQLCLSCQLQLTLQVSTLQRCLACSASPQPPQQAIGTLGLCCSARMEQCDCGLVFPCSSLCWSRPVSPDRTHCVGGCLLLEQRSCWEISVPSSAAPVCCRQEQAELSPLGNVFFPLQWVCA